MKKIDTFFFSNLKPEQFVFRAIYLSFIGDLSYLVFLKIAISSEANLKKWMHEYAFLPNMQLILENPAMVKQMWENFTFFLNGMIALLVLTNVIGYCFFFYKKKFGISYMKNLALTGFIFSILTLWEAANHGRFWQVVMILLIPLYFYIYRGMKHYYKF